MGQAGVTKTLELIHKEFDTTMALCGCRRIEEIDRSILLFEDDSWAAPLAEEAGKSSPVRAVN